VYVIPLTYRPRRITYTDRSAPGNGKAGRRVPAGDTVPGLVPGRNGGPRTAYTTATNRRRSAPAGPGRGGPPPLRATTPAAWPVRR